VSVGVGVRAESEASVGVREGGEGGVLDGGPLLLGVAQGQCPEHSTGHLSCSTHASPENAIRV
jgi:hypothetical protein